MLPKNNTLRKVTTSLLSENLLVVVSTPFGNLAICDLSIKISRRSSQGNPSVEGLNEEG